MLFSHMKLNLERPSEMFFCGSITNVFGGGVACNEIVLVTFQTLSITHKHIPMLRLTQKIFDTAGFVDLGLHYGSFSVFKGSKCKKKIVTEDLFVEVFANRRGVVKLFHNFLFLFFFYLASDRQGGPGEPGRWEFRQEAR